jgi:hypothetical protein
MRISDADLTKALLRRILELPPYELSTLAKSLLGVSALYDQLEHMQWDVYPIEGEYAGVFEENGVTIQPKDATKEKTQFSSPFEGHWLSPESGE